MRRKYLLIAVGVALFILFLVRNDEPRFSEEVFENEAPSFIESQKDLRAEESPESLLVDDAILDPLPIAPTKFKNGTLEFFIDFEDSSISAEQAYRISQDLNNVFSHLSARLVRHGDQKKLVFEGKGRNWPDALDSVRILRSRNGRDSLYINTSVSEAYKKAFDFIEQKGINEAEVAGLLDNLTSGDSSIADVAVLSLQSVPSKKLEEVLEEMSEGQIKQPSVLAYRILPEQAPDAVFAETLFLELNNEVATYAEVVGLVQVNGKWKIAL
jgi:hypothetical protein